MWTDNNQQHHDKTLTQVLTDLSRNNKSKKNNPRLLRLGAVTAAMMDLLDLEKDDEAVLAAQVYTNVLTTMEGTLTKQDSSSSIEEVSSTLVALMDLLIQTIPYVSTPTLWTTLGWLIRILKAIGKLMATMDASSKDNSKQNSNSVGPNATLRAVCQVSTTVLMKLNTANVPSKQQEQHQVQQLFQYTLLKSIQDVKPKVRKQAQDCVMILLQQQQQQGSVVDLVKKTLSQYMSAVLQPDNLDTNDQDAKVLHDCVS